MSHAKEGRPFREGRGVPAMKEEKGKSILEGDEHLSARHQEFLQIIKRGAEFTEEVLKENERLRFRTA